MTVANCALGDIVEVRSSLDDPKLSENAVLPHVSPEHISSGSMTIRWNDVRSCSEDGVTSGKYVFQTGDILYSKIRPYLNKVAPADRRGMCSADMYALVPDQSKISPSYLLHWLNDKAFLDYAASVSGRANIPKINRKHLLEATIPLPPLEEQKRIAGILDQAAELCRLRTRALDKLNTLGQAIFHEMFGSVHSNPYGFDRVPLAHLIKVGSGQGLTAKDMIPGDFPVYGGNGINGYHNEGSIGPDRIVIGRVGVYCGAVHVTKQPCWVTDNALLVKQLKPCSVTYLAEALRVADLNQYAGRAAQPLISGSRIYPVEILLPPKEKQEEFEKALESMSQQQHVAERAQAQSDKLFASLQDRAFRGELGNA